MIRTVRDHLFRFFGDFQRSYLNLYLFYVVLEGKDGLTHNMLDLLHRHWKRRRVCRIKCYGVPTVDMNNLCRVIEV